MPDTLRTPYNPPLTVGEAIRLLGPDAIPFDALDNPTMFLITALYERDGFRRAEIGIAPSWLATNTDYRLAKDSESGYQRILFRCPICFNLYNSRLDHVPEDKHPRAFEGETGYAA
jgi:hypothetical protein